MAESSTAAPDTSPVLTLAEAASSGAASNPSTDSASASAAASRETPSGALGCSEVAANGANAPCASNSAGSRHDDTHRVQHPATAASRDDVRDAAAAGDKATRAWTNKEMATFWNTGYITLRGFVTDDEVKLLLREIAHMDDNQWFSTTRDLKRRETTIAIHDSPPAAIRLAFQRFVKLASNVHPAWSVLERIKVVQSLPNARGEQLHHDFESAETAVAVINHQWVQASLLLVLEPDTKRLVVPDVYGGAPVTTNCTALDDLIPGDLVVYRGDLPHADVPYKEGNIRIQGCINVDGVDNGERLVERVAWAFYRYEFCFKPCEDKRELKNRKRFCKENPTKAAIARKRKQNNEKGVYCEGCRRHFSLKNTYHAHKCTGASADDEGKQEED